MSTIFRMRGLPKRVTASTPTPAIPIAPVRFTGFLFLSVPSQFRLMLFS